MGVLDMTRNPNDSAYHDLLRLVLNEGERRDDRTGTGTLSVFGTQSRYDLRSGFPLITTKKINFDLVVAELLWFLSGSTNIGGLGDARKLWEPWADDNGDLGPIYSRQWMAWGEQRSNVGRFGGINQITQVIESIRINPFSRRHIVSAWNVAEIDQMALPPCHVLFQFYVSSDGENLDCHLYQRSADLAVGVPFNIASYALLLEMIAAETGKQPRYLIHSIGDAHIYANHLAGVEEQLLREPKLSPTLSLRVKPVLEMTADDIFIEDYDSHPFIRFQVAV